MKVPAWPELSIERIFPLALLIKDFIDYIPDDWEYVRKVSRKYFFEIICTLARQWIAALIQDIRQKKYQAKVDRVVDQKDN